MGVLKKIGKAIKKTVKGGLKLTDKAFISGPYNWLKDHPKELGIYAGIVGGGAALGYGLAGAGAAGAASTGATGGTTGAVAAGTTAAQVAKASASNSMWPWLAASMGTNAVNAYMQNQANQQALAWQQYLANNSHRIEVADLIAAGLNPAASANQGAGGGAYNPTAPNIDNPIVTAMQIKQLEEQTKQIEQETAIRQPEVLKAMQDIKYLKKHDHSRLRNIPNATKEQMALAALETLGDMPTNEGPNAQAVKRFEEKMDQRTRYIPSPFKIKKLYSPKMTR